MRRPPPQILIISYVVPDTQEQALDSRVEVGNFIFSQPQEGAGVTDSAFMAMLYLRHLMSKKWEGLILPDYGTRRVMGDLKAVFLRPSDPAKAGVKKRTDTTPTSYVLGRRHSKRAYTYVVDELLKPMWDSVKGIWKDTFDAFTGLQTEISLDDRDRPFWYTVAFYDTAGEMLNYGDFHLKSIEQSVDKMAVLVKASDIFDTSDGINLGLTNTYLQHLEQAGHEWSLVVSQLDTSSWLQGKKDIRTIVDDLSNAKEPGQQARELLITWLRQELAETSSSSRVNGNRLSLLSRLEDSHAPVFFVWTEGLPQHKSDPGSSAQSSSQNSSYPTSHGLRQFICWCLGIRWEEVNLKRNFE